ncbi:hypothetical protein [Pseudonocardia humida]|uniref:Oligosaccharide repeat unit polymerase n=1 Tax=Pseudonocardia humida TaxID=2800819 RepID=A0ABT0ZT05_9PSEU|nr:hypothetical protein [Pseudonocardia humida]MCO1653877.1 hypothetical protein [Pseudonocardia humida]
MIALLILFVATTAMLIVRITLLRASSAPSILPIGLFVGYLAVATGVVPVLWVIGWAQPWSEIASDPYLAASVTTLALLVTAFGVILACPPGRVSEISLRTPGTKLDVALFGGLAVGVLGYLVLAASAGGPVALLYTLADRRELLAGTGPLRILLIVSAVACIYGALHADKTTRQRMLTWACGLVYAASTLLTGSRFQVIVLAVAVICAHVRVNGWSRRLKAGVLVTVLAVVPLSTIYGLEVRTGLTYGQEVEWSDPATGTVTINSLVGPFVRGGLDTIRTTGVAAAKQEPFALNPELAVGSLANLVPRSVWPAKPEGAATQFSRQYFLSKWVDGTGVPPSIFAEFFHSFGLFGGLAALLLLGILLTRLSFWMMSRPRLYWTMLAPFFAADCIQLAKGGSDGFLRTLVLHIGAVMIMVLIARSAGTTLNVEPGSPATSEQARSGAR